MEFAGINYVAVLIAAIASMGIGAGWYSALRRQWMNAAGVNDDDIEQKPSIYIVAGLCQLVIAFFLAGMIGHLGVLTFSGGAVTAFFCWLGFVVPPMAVNHRFQGSGWDLTAIDAGHWLLVFLLQGAIIGWFGA